MLNVITFGPKCNKVLNVITFGPKCNKVLNVITFGPRCNKVLNVISLQCNRLTALVRCCYSWHPHWDVKVTAVALKILWPIFIAYCGPADIYQRFLFAKDLGWEALATKSYTDVLLASNWPTQKQWERWPIALFISSARTL